MQIRVQNKAKRVWKSRYDGDVSTPPSLTHCLSSSNSVDKLKVIKKNFYKLCLILLSQICKASIQVFSKDSLLQDAANATLRLETLSRKCVWCINRKWGCKKPSKKVQNVWDGGVIKHDSDFSCVCDAGHTVNPFELFAMSQNNRNGQPYQCVCDIWHTVRSDELFAIRECNGNG